MREFIRQKYNILIPAFLLIVLLIAVLLYTMEYKNNRYAKESDTEVYQYFSGVKMEYTALIGRNKKDVILSYSNKDFAVSLDSTPIYLKDKDSVIFPKEMSIFFPLYDKQYRIPALSEVYKKNDLYYLNIKNLNKSYDHAFMYDGKNLYFFFDEVTIEVEGETITLSPMSYLSCSYLNLLEYYDRETDTYRQIELKSGNVIVQNDVMKLDVSLDKVIYENSFTLLGTDFNSLLKITDTL